MSDYLFRMIERAAGTATASAPQPPREVHWPLLPEAPDSFMPASSFRYAGAPPTPRHPRNGDVENNAPFVSPKQHDPALPMPPLIAPAAVEAQRSSQYEVIAHSATLARADENHEPVSREGVPQETGTDTEIRDTAIGGPSHDPISVRQMRKTPAPSARSDAFPAPDFHPTAQVFSPQPVSVPAAKARTIAVVQPSETPEPAVEVKIGRVEVRFDSPATPAAPTRSPRPSGFVEFAALRRYVTQPWPSGNR